MEQQQSSDKWGISKYECNPSSIAEPYQSFEPRTNTDRENYPRPNGQAWYIERLYPGCDAEPFGGEDDLERHYQHAHSFDTAETESDNYARRSADLQRHYKNAHAPESAKDTYRCDYLRCTRYHEPFHRRDHYRDHLREYHQEDIQKRGAATAEDRLEDRYLPSDWWRCQRCLIRVYVTNSGFECPGCKTSGLGPKRHEK
ncbi:hypothetical protein ACJ41O_006774 [Fusarium nematophilum]